MLEKGLNYMIFKTLLNFAIYALKSKQQTAVADMWLKFWSY